MTKRRLTDADSERRHKKSHSNLLCDGYKILAHFSWDIIPSLLFCLSSQWDVNGMSMECGNEEAFQRNQIMMIMMR